MKSTFCLSSSCVVCGFSDSRGLTNLALADGRSVVVCGTHALVSQRSCETAPATIGELREVARDRRARSRRGDAADLSADSLSAELNDAFARGRRVGSDRRAS